MALQRLAPLLVAALLAATGCTTYRIVRWRDPLPHQPQHIFPQGVVRRAGVPFAFAQAAPPRQDLDTLSVRDVDGTMVPFATYLARRRIRAFVVIRDDTVLYERYAGWLRPDRRWGSFSMAKSVTSVLLGAALAAGQVRSLDDPVSAYVPEAARNPAFAGVTLRHLLGMRSGFAYTRADGRSLWRDLRSSDAHFFYTTDRTRSLLAMRREDPPGARWAYKDSDTDLLGLVLERATGRSLARQLEEVVWSRIGAESDASFDLDHAGGLASASAGLNATARDYARLGRLVLHDGRVNGARVLDSAWVRATTELDRSRTEPEVVTWYRMQHTGYWWIPMHDWDAQRDFFADGSRGQRLYVHRPSRTIIVQLAEDSEQEFPFRRVTQYLLGNPWRYPVGIAGSVLRAGRAAGADSAAATLTRLLDAERRDPAGFVLNEASLLGVAETLRREKGAAVGDAVLLAARARYGASCRYRAAVEAAGLGAQVMVAGPCRV